MRNGNQSIAPLSGYAKHTRDTSTPQQQQLPTGPVGLKKLPDNRDFWATVNAVTFTQRGTGRREVYRAIAYYAGLTTDRECFAAGETIAQRATLSWKATRRQIHALERGEYIEAIGGHSKGRNGTRYRLVLPPPNPTDERDNTMRQPSPIEAKANKKQPSRKGHQGRE